jgi:hypothetical protein
MKRIVRFIWVLAANAFVAGFTILRLSAALSSRDTRDVEVWLEILLEVIFPIVGIILDGTGRKSAKWVNIGWASTAAIFWLAEALRWHSDPFFGVLLLLSLGMFTVAGLMVLVYRTEKSVNELQRQPY